MVFFPNHLIMWERCLRLFFTSSILSSLSFSLYLLFSWPLLGVQGLAWDVRYHTLSPTLPGRNKYSFSRYYYQHLSYSIPFHDICCGRLYSEMGSTFLPLFNATASVSVNGTNSDSTRIPTRAQRKHARLSGLIRFINLSLLLVQKMSSAGLSFAKESLLPHRGFTKKNKKPIMKRRNDLIKTLLKPIFLFRTFVVTSILVIIQKCINYHRSLTEEVSMSLFLKVIDADNISDVHDNFLLDFNLLPVICIYRPSTTSLIRSCLCE